MLNPHARDNFIHNSYNVSRKNRNIRLFQIRRNGTAPLRKAGAFTRQRSLGYDETLLHASAREGQIEIRSHQGQPGYRLLQVRRLRAGVNVIKDIRENCFTLPVLVVI